MAVPVALQPIVSPGARLAITLVTVFDSDRGFSQLVIRDSHIGESTLPLFVTTKLHLMVSPTRMFDSVNQGSAIHG